MEKPPSDPSRAALLRGLGVIGPGGAPGDARRRQERLEHRDRVLTEIGGEMTYDAILKTAISRCIARVEAEGRSHMYGTWHQHNGTKTKVFEAFRQILRELCLDDKEQGKLKRELDQEYGTGQDLYFE